MPINIKETLDVVLDPKYLRPIILGVAILILFRNVYYLLFSDVTRLFLQGQQETLEMIFDVEVPMLLMTVIWPVIFAALNRLHSSLKVNPAFFYGTLLIHAVTCLIAAYLILSGGCFEDPFTLPTGEVIRKGCNPIEFNSTVWGGAILTMLSVGLSHYIYSVKSLFIVQGSNTEQD